MDYRFTFVHMGPSDAMKEYAQTHINKIEKFGLHKPGKIHFIFSIEREEKKTEILADFGSFHFEAHAKDTDMYVSIDDAIAKIERQLSKTKDKKTSHRAVALAKEWARRALTFGRAEEE